VGSAKPSARRRPREANRHAGREGHPDLEHIRGFVERRRSWTSCLVSCAAGSHNGVPRASTPIENGTVTGRHWHFPCWYAGAVSSEGPVWAFLPGSAWPRCRRGEAPLPIAGRDAEGVVVAAVIAMAVR
jgi:hypothetical protein